MLTRTRSENCLSDLRLDQLLAGELDASAESTTRAHLASCSSCAARLAVIEVERAQFLAESPPLEQPKKQRNLYPLFASVLAAAAAVALLASGALSPGLSRSNTPSARPQIVPEAARAKGGSKIGFYVARGSTTVLGGPGEVLLPGDRLQFYYSTAEAGYFALLSVDGARRASVYFPAGGVAAPIQPGSEVALSNSTVLDATLGNEAIYGLFCGAPIALGPLRASLAAAPEEPPSVAGCHVDRLEIVKRARP